MGIPEVAPLVYSIPDAARALKCSRSLVYDLVKAGRLPHVHLSTKRVVIPRSMLERYLQEQTEGGDGGGDGVTP